MNICFNGNVFCIFRTPQSIRYLCEVYHRLGKILVKKYGKSAKNLGDEGGFAPALTDPDEALKLIEQVGLIVLLLLILLFL